MSVKICIMVWPANMRLYIDGWSADILHLWRSNDDVPVCHLLYENVDLHPLHAANSRSLPSLSQLFQRSSKHLKRDEPNGICTRS